MSEPGPTWEKINGLVYGQCINCNSRKWRLVKTGKFREKIFNNSLIKPDLLLESIGEINSLI